MAFELDPNKPIQLDWMKVPPRDYDDFEDITGGMDLYTFCEAITQLTDRTDVIRRRDFRVGMAAVTWIAMRRAHPGLTFDEVYDEVGALEAMYAIELVDSPLAERRMTNGAAVTVAKPPAQRGARRTQQPARTA